MTLLQFLNLPGFGGNCIRKFICFSVRVGAWCTGLPTGLPIKEYLGDTSLQSTASDGHHHTPRGHNLNYPSGYCMLNQEVKLFNVTLWAHPFQKGRALSHPPSQSEHALPERGAPSPKGARPLQKGRALSKRGAPSPKGARPLQKGRALSKRSAPSQKGLPSPLSNSEPRT